MKIVIESIYYEDILFFVEFSYETPHITTITPLYAESIKLEDSDIDLIEVLDSVIMDRIIDLAEANLKSKLTQP